MMKRLMLLTIALLGMLMLSGCGTQVTSVIEFNKDGSGKRVVSATISESDATNLEGGYYELDLLLEAKAPKEVNLIRTMKENGDAVYSFSFRFDNIDEYNQKVQEITGKAHDATWYSDTSVFLSDIEFRESQVTYDLVKWAIDAFNESEYSDWMSGFTSYEIGTNEIYFEDKLVYSGTEDPGFVMEMTPKVKTASVYSIYDYDDNYAKTIVLQFHQGDLDMVNLSDAKKLLSAYSKNYKIDMANHTITFTLENESVKEFLMLADLNCGEEDIFYQSVFNPFQKKVEIKETYNLGQFFSMFSLEYPYIYNYIKLPEKLSDVSVSYTNQLPDIEVPQGYHYAGAYRYDKDYQISFFSNTMVNLNNISVDYLLGSDRSGQRVVKVSFSKNECDLTEGALKKFYPDMPDIMSISDAQDEITISFTTMFSSLSEDTNQLGVEQLPKRNLKDTEFVLEDSLDLSKYLPQIKGYRWQLNDIEAQYSVRMSEEIGLDEFVFQQKTYAMHPEQGELSLLEHQEGSQYVISESAIINMPVMISVRMTDINKMFYLYVFFFVFIVVASIMIYCIVRMYRNNQAGKEQTRSDYGPEVINTREFTPIKNK